MPRSTINKKTKGPISDFTIRQVFKTMCYDEKEDDPWQFLSSLQQDCLTDAMKPPRVRTANHVLNHISESAAWNFVAIDPCISLLPIHQNKADLLKVAAVGIKKWMSMKNYIYMFRNQTLRCMRMKRLLKLNIVLVTIDLENLVLVVRR